MCTCGYMQLSLTQNHSCKHSPFQSKWHRSIYGNGLFAYRPTAALIGYAALVCRIMPVNAIESFSGAFSLQENPLHTKSCIVNFVSVCFTESG